MNTEPIRTVLVPVALAAFAAAAQAFIDGATTRGVITAVLGALIVAAQEYARSQVTPTGTGQRLGDERGLALLEAVVLLLVVAVVVLAVLVF